MIINRQKLSINLDDYVPPSSLINYVWKDPVSRLSTWSLLKFSKYLYRIIRKNNLIISFISIDIYISKLI